MGKCKHKWGNWQVQMQPRKLKWSDTTRPIRGRMCRRCRKWQMQELRGNKWQ